VISPDGTVVRRSTTLFRPALLSASVPVRSTLTPAVRLGVAPEIVLCAVAIAGLAWSLVAARPRRGRRRTAPVSAVDTVGAR
jgi:apolipoprotein N-acyltransferase